MRELDMAQFHILSPGKAAIVQPVILKISVSDVLYAVGQGFSDFTTKPSHYIFAILIAPVICCAMYLVALDRHTMQHVFPLGGGGAVLGPMFGLFLYEMSRIIELNLNPSWRQVFKVRNNPAIPAIIALSIMLFGLFLLWLLTADTLYEFLYSSEYPASVIEFLNEIIGTKRGWTLIIFGNTIGFCFALLALSTTVIAFPLLLDRDVGVVCAIETSLNAMKANSVPLLTWGIIVVIGLLLGLIFFVVGLVVILPVFGHATWHIYRKVIGCASRVD
jgi:uncharacterized membrane protein